MAACSLILPSEIALPPWRRSGRPACRLPASTWPAPVGDSTSESSDGGSESRTPEEQPSRECRQVRLFQELALSDESPGTPRHQPTPVGWWRLIWCHERCHKGECELLRNTVNEAAAQAGARLIALKKASKFAMWLGRTRRPPFILLTDWREAKPCMRIITQVHPEPWPAAVIVLCSLQQQVGRAAVWARDQPLPVRVCVDTGCPQVFVQDMFKWLSGLGVVPRPPSCQEDVQQMPQRQVQWQLTAPMLAVSSVGLFQCVEVPYAASVAPRCPPAVATGGAPWLSTVAPAVPAPLAPPRAVLPPQPAVAAPRLHPGPLSQGVAGLADGSLRDTVQLVQMLKEAMPDHYDE